MSEERNLLTEGREPLALQLERLSRCLDEAWCVMREKVPEGTGSMFDEVFVLLDTSIDQLNYIREPFNDVADGPQNTVGFKGTERGVLMEFRMEGLPYQFEAPADYGFRMHNALLSALAEHMRLSNHPQGETAVEFIKLMRQTGPV